MKWYKQYFSFSFAAIIVVAISIQAFHSYEHLHRVFKEKQCHHIYAKNKTVIGHKHLELDHCFTCKFTFSNALESNRGIISSYLSNFNYKLQSTQAFEFNSFYNGSSFFLRGPPTV
jgi:hypothetical protein